MCLKFTHPVGALILLEAGSKAPLRLQIADDTTTAAKAYQAACAGIALLWQGDFQNARQLLQAMGRRAQGKPRKASKPLEFPAAFHAYRMAQAQKTKILSMLMVQVEADRRIQLRRAPDWREAMDQAWGPPDGQVRLVPLRELLGVVSAFEWRKKGVPIAQLEGLADGCIHPHYGVFSPVRGDYLALVARAPLKQHQLAFDIGVGTGVLSAMLLQRGVQQVVATDSSERALACAADNFARLQLQDRVQLLQTDLFPPGRAPLVVCNPPWLPGRANTLLDQAIYDEDSRMLRGFLQGLRAHLEPEGEGWLIMSDLAERLQLRPRAQWMQWVTDAGLQVVGEDQVAPTHPRSQDSDDVLYEARRHERTSLWRLSAAPA